MVQKRIARARQEEESRKKQEKEKEEVLRVFRKGRRLHILLLREVCLMPHLPLVAAEKEEEQTAAPLITTVPYPQLPPLPHLPVKSPLLPIKQVQQTVLQASTLERGKEED